MKQPSSKPLTVRSILVVVGLIALNVVLILAYLYFIHYPHSAYASGDPGQLDAQYEGARVVDQRLGSDYSYYVLRTADGGSTFLAIEHARFFKRYRIGYAQVLPDDRPCTVEFALDGTYRSATIGSADVIETAGINGSAPGVTLTVSRIQFWGAFLVIAMVIVELVAYHLLKKLLRKRTSPKSPGRAAAAARFLQTGTAKPAPLPKSAGVRVVLLFADCLFLIIRIRSLSRPGRV